MKIEEIQNSDIGLLRELQPEQWTDIRPHFYFYSASDFCKALKISEHGKILAVGATIQHQDSAWIAHIIVHPEHRNKGLGREITASLIEDLDSGRFRTIYLDATEMGYPVYKKLGFQIETEYIHMLGSRTDQYLSDPSAVVPYHFRFRDELLTLDKQISAEHRKKVLEPHLHSSLVYIMDGQIQGAYFPSLLDGYVMAKTRLAGIELMKIRMRSKPFARFPSDNIACIDFLLESGYEITGESKRMVLGEKRNWDGKGIFHRISGGLG